MPTINNSESISGGGINISGSLVRVADSASGLEPALPVAFAGTLTTRTNNSSGVVTTTLAHNITATDFVDVFAPGGRRYGVDVTAIGANTITLDIGSGDNLPALNQPIVVAKRVRINLAIDGDVTSIIGMQLQIPDTTDTARGHVSFFDVGNTEIAAVDLSANEVRVYDLAGGATNIFTGNPITYAQASNGSSVNAATLKMIVGQDSTP